MLASQDRISDWNRRAFSQSVAPFPSVALVVGLLSLAVIVLAVIVMVTSHAHAQQQPSPNEQAMGAKLMQEIQGGLNCSASLIGVQTDLAKANARIKELEAKPEVKK